MIELPTPETDALFWKHGYPVEIDTSKAMLLCEKLEKERDFAIEKYKLLESCFKRAERERDEARDQNAKLRDIAERAIELAVQYYDGPCERDAAKLRAELDQLMEGAK